MDTANYVWIAAAPFLLVGQIYLLGRKMSEPEKMMLPITQLTAEQGEALARYQDWLAAEQLEYRTCFKFGAIAVVVYQQHNTPRFFSFFFHKKLTFSVESYLEDLTILDTATSGSSGLFPRPGAYLQSFPNLTPQEAWQRHLAGEAYLTQKFGYVWSPLKEPYEEIMLKAIRVRMQYNRSQFLWPVRVLYRYFVTRHSVKNRTIAQQFP